MFYKKEIIMPSKILFTIITTSFILLACNAQSSTDTNTYKVNKTEAEWKKLLSAEEYHVLREKGTERPGTGDLNENKAKGIYTCAACNYELFHSDHKYESGSGWPAFDRPIKQENVNEITDSSYGMTRVEIVCSNCAGHLGHMFEDGPRNTTGLRYCINSVSLNFEKEEN